MRYSLVAICMWVAGTSAEGEVLTTPIPGPTYRRVADNQSDRIPSAQPRPDWPREGASPRTANTIEAFPMGSARGGVVPSGYNRTRPSDRVEPVQYRADANNGEQPAPETGGVSSPWTGPGSAPGEAMGNGGAQPAAPWGGTNYLPAQPSPSANGPKPILPPNDDSSETAEDPLSMPVRHDHPAEPKERPTDPFAMDSRQETPRGALLRDLPPSPASVDSRYQATRDADPPARAAQPMTLLLLFASIGLNVYLFWITWDTYNRYQDLVQDVRSSRARRERGESEYSERSADPSAY